MLDGLSVSEKQERIRKERTCKEMQYKMDETCSSFVFLRAPGCRQC